MVRRNIAANVCVSAVVRFRSHVLSHETKRGTKIKTYSLHLTAPLQKHFVGRSFVKTPLVLGSMSRNTSLDNSQI